MLYANMVRTSATVPCTLALRPTPQQMKKLALACIVASLVVAGESHAQINVNTGTNAGGALLADLALDPYWTISLNGGSTFTAAKAASSTNPIIYPGMCNTNCVNANWVLVPSINGTNTNTAWGVRNAVNARRTFDLTGYNLATVSLNGFFRIADNSFGAFLNGVYIPGSIIGTDTWGFDNALTANAGFVNGINTLELRGESYNSNWDGFYVEAVVQGVNNVVPEPSTYALMGLGLSIVGPIARRRRGVSRAA